MTYRASAIGDREGHHVDPAPPLCQAVSGEQDVPDQAAVDRDLALYEAFVGR